MMVVAVVVLTLVVGVMLHGDTGDGRFVVGCLHEVVKYILVNVYLYMLVYV